MEKEVKIRYDKSKLIVKLWEDDFRKANLRIPSKADIREAPFNVRQSYKIYYKLKSNFLSQTLINVLDDDDSSFDLYQTEPKTNSMTINNLQDTEESLPHIIESSVAHEDLSEFKAVQHLTINNNAWNDQMKKKNLSSNTIKKPNFQKKISMSLEPVVVKPPRNPKKSLSKIQSPKTRLFEDAMLLSSEVLPDLETILLEKSRATPVSEIKKPDVNGEIKKSIDKKWLDRNTDVDPVPMETVSDISLASLLPSTSSFGLSNLKITSLSTVIEAKLHQDDLDIVGNSDEELNETEIIQVAKKRRVSVNSHEPPVKPKRLSIRNRKDIIMENSDSEPEVSTERTQTESPSVLRRNRSIIKRSKDGIKKITNKLLSQGKKSRKNLAEDLPEDDDPVKFLIDSDLSSMTTIPRASQDFLKTTETFFNSYCKQQDTVLLAKKPAKVLVDNKTHEKKLALEKKISTGTLNENFVRVNLKKKVFVKGKKAFSFSKYKKGVWKSKKAAALSGPEMDMRGCDGGVLKCFACGGVGHFAQHCKQKGDNLLPIDVEIKDESPFLTLEEAAELANDQKLAKHANKPENLPVAPNEIWNNDKSNENLRKGEGDTDKENKNGNSENVTDAEPLKPYVGHKIPEDFLKKAGLLDVSVSNKDNIAPLYKLNPDGSLPPTPKEVFDALKMFGHKNFRHGQERAVMRVLCGMSTLVTLSTGSGKSLCYQLAAFLYRKYNHCITLVISPLVSLMEDQVHGIPEFINAQCLHTNQTPRHREKVMEAIKDGRVEILLISPEAVVSGEKSTGFGCLLRQLPPIAFACIDEAHCVSQWSHNFRPSYLMISRVLREKMGVKTVLGLTATATLQTRESIICHLEIPDGLNGIISDTPLPDNLILTVSRDDNRDQALISLLRSERFKTLSSIIIYCTRRDECERIAGFLRTCLQTGSSEIQEASTSKKRKRSNHVSEAYHAGLPASRRRTIQNSFMSDELRIVVATIAFGMGINKSDIRGIIHYNMPKSFESYVQEVGRAGRDGKPAQCHVFLDSKSNDLNELRRHIYSNSIDRHVIRKLLQKVFVSCSCSQRVISPSSKSLSESSFAQNFQKLAGGFNKSRYCVGHEVSFSIDETVQLLDIPEENISTLLCYLELHGECYIKVLGNSYTKCKVISYGGPKYLKQMAKTCPPLAMAIAFELKKSKDENEEIASIEFDVVDVAAAIGWDSGVVKYQLKQLEWTNLNGALRRSSLTVTFSNLGFRIRSPGDLTDEELDTALDSLEKRATMQEKAQLIQLQIIFNTFETLAFKNVSLCSGSNSFTEASNALKSIIRRYFQSNLPMDEKIEKETSDTTDNEIASDIKQVISMYPENNFSGRSLARLFHGISSPCYPAVIWGRCKYWRAHMSVDFKRLVALGNTELVKMRRIE